METPRKQAWLVYDGECPLCTRWCLRARIRDAVGELHLVDARQRIFYPPSKMMRNLVLKLLGVKYIGNLAKPA